MNNNRSACIPAKGMPTPGQMPGNISAIFFIDASLAIRDGRGVHSREGDPNDVSLLAVVTDGLELPIHQFQKTRE